MTTTIRSFAFALAALAALATPGAARSETTFHPERVSMIQIGETTRAQIIEWFGEPQARRDSTRKTVWSYRAETGVATEKATSVLGGLLRTASPVRLPNAKKRRERHSLRVTFSPEGVVTDYDYASR